MEISVKRRNNVNIALLLMLILSVIFAFLLIVNGRANSILVIPVLYAGLLLASSDTKNSLANFDFITLYESPDKWGARTLKT